MSGEPDDYYWLYDDPIWSTAEIDQLKAKAREANQRAIRSALFGRWVYGTVFLLDLIVFLVTYITGKFAWYAVLSMVVVAGCAYGNERMLKSSRERQQ